MKILKIAIAISWIIRFIRIQLFMTLISFPILVSWGIPFSTLSLLGNLIFSPILIVFLLLCSIIFFSELIGFHSNFFIYLLEYVCKWWWYLLQWPDNRYMIGISKPPTYILVLVPLCIFGTLFYKKTKKLFTSTIMFALILLLTLLFCTQNKKNCCNVEKIPCNGGYVTLIVIKDKLILIDPGVIGQRISASSWIEYTLIPHIIKTTGKTIIDHVILLQPNKTIFDAVTLLCTKMQVKNVYLPVWEGHLKKSTWNSFFDLKKAINSDNKKLIRINKKPISFVINNKNSVIIKPIEKKIKKHEMSYSVHKVIWYIENNTTDHLYSIGYKKIKLLQT